MGEHFSAGNLCPGAEIQCGQQQMSLQGLSFKGEEDRSLAYIFSLLTNNVWTNFIGAEQKAS